MANSILEKVANHQNGRFTVRDGDGPRPVSQIVIHKGTEDPISLTISEDKRNLPDKLQAILGGRGNSGRKVPPVQDAKQAPTQAPTQTPPRSLEEAAPQLFDNQINGVAADEFLMGSSAFEIQRPATRQETPPADTRPAKAEPNRGSKEPVRVTFEKPDGDVIECWYDDVLVTEGLITLYFHHDGLRRFVYRPGQTADTAEPMAVCIGDDSVHLCRSPGIQIRHNDHEYILLVIEETAPDENDFVSAGELLDPHGMMTGSGKIEPWLNGEPGMLPMFHTSKE